MTLHVEDPRPEALPTSAISTFTTDRFGLITVPWKEEYASCHWVFDKTGYAPVDEIGAESDRVELVPGSVVGGRLLDPTGAPAAGAKIELFVGCEHSPSVREATVDGEGNFLLTDVLPGDGTLWATLPNGAAEYWQPALEPRPVAVYAPIRARPGITVRGTARDDAGRTLAGVVIYSTQTPRGPKTASAADGSFLLAGVAPDAELKASPPNVRLEYTSSSPPSAGGRADDVDSERRKVVVRAAGDPEKWQCWIEAAEEPRTAVDSEIVLETQREGDVLLRFAHADFGEGEFPITVSVNGDTRLDMSRLTAPGLMVVFDERGWPVEDASIEFWHSQRWELLAGSDWQDQQAIRAVWSFRLKDGAFIRIARPGKVPVRRRLEGRSPFVVRLGGATLGIRVTNVDRFVCMVDGDIHGSHLEADDEGKQEVEVIEEGADVLEPNYVRVAGLDAGEHVVLVGARGSVSRWCQVSLRENEVRDIVVELKERR
ncbi:MAG: hypothetical protein ACT4PV_12390 [Planctomycetaceae bacterium]